MNNKNNKIISTIQPNGQCIDNLNIGDTIYAVEKTNNEYGIKQFTVCMKKYKDVDIKDGEDKLGQPIYKQTPFLYLTLIHENQRYTYKTNKTNINQFLIITTRPYRQIECFTEYGDAAKFINMKLKTEYAQLQQEIKERAYRMFDIYESMKKFA